MRSKDTAKASRRKKIAWIAVAILLALGVARFLTLRAADRAAWPAAAPDVVFDPAGGRPPAGRLASPDDAAAIVEALSPPPADLVAEYQAYQTYGFATHRAYPRIDARLRDSAPAREAFAALWASCDGLDPAAGSVAYNAFAGRSAEITLLGCYEAAALVQAAPTNPVAAQIRLDLLAGAVKLTRGAGLLGRAAGINNAMLVVRDSIMAPSAWNDRAACTSHIARVRALEPAVGALDDAVRADWIAIRQSVSTMYAQMSGTNPPPAEAGRRIPGKSAFIVRSLGGTEAGTQTNLDALLSRLVQNAAAPYAPDGLTAGLPPWCTGKSRPPWTRDPIGAAVASAYLKNAALGHAAGPGLLLELRAARIVAALQFHRAAEGAWPATLGALLDDGLLEAGDLADPFSKDGAGRLGYALDGDGWRLHSVGLDQVDGGGLVDAYRTKDPQARSTSDFVFISRERETRLAAAPPTAGTAAAGGN